MSRHAFNILLTLCLILVPAGALSAHQANTFEAEAAFEDGEPRAKLSLVFSHDFLGEDDDEMWVGIHFRMHPEWHIYWKTSGESGLATEVGFSSDDMDFDALQWPAPVTFLDPSRTIATIGYEDEVLLFSRAKVVKNEGTLKVDAIADFLVCKVECIPGRVELTNFIKRQEESVPSKSAGLFEAALALLPQSSQALGLSSEVLLTRRGRDLQARVAVAPVDLEREGSSLDIKYEVERFAFLPGPGTIDWRTRAIEREGPAFVLDLEGRTRGQSEDCVLDGVIRLLQNDTPQAVAIQQTVACADVPEAAAVPRSIRAGGGAPVDSTPTPFWLILLMALIGGMLLNLMPCVFPVLALKTVALVQLAHENRSSVFSHTAAYTAGIVGSMMVLALAVIALKVTGEQVGWGFQFQEPWFIAFLGVILVLFALNLFGVFEVTLAAAPSGLAAGEYSLRRSFGEGILAVILATPCSAPLLGTAVGFALGSTSLTIVLVFLMLGLGLALPFALLVAFPRWRNLLPKPGHWMVHLKQGLGFALLGTVVWLVWVLGQNAGNDAVASFLAVLCILALGVWIWGRVQFSTGKARAIGLAIIAGLFGLGSWLFLPLPVMESVAAGPRTSGSIEWLEFNESAVDAELAKDRVVFIDFTADWCITCKFNERTVIQTRPVIEVVEELDVAMFKADWTRRDEKIRAILESYGKAGVPMYLVYGPGLEEAKVLPELLTANLLMDALQEAAQQ